MDKIEPHAQLYWEQGRALLTNKDREWERDGSQITTGYY
jgi:hypothetical protein